MGAMKMMMNRWNNLAKAFGGAMRVCLALGVLLCLCLPAIGKLDDAKAEQAEKAPAEKSVAEKPQVTDEQPTTPAKELAKDPAAQASAQPKLPSVPSPTGLGIVPSYRKASNVAIITIKGEIDGGGRFGESVMVASIERRIRTATRAGADAIVFELDTPGGELGASLRIASLIKDSPVANTVAWVRPSALSGGAVAAIAAREIIVADPVQFGDAMPIQFGRKGVQSVRDPELLKKILPPLISDVVDSARRHNEAMATYGRDEYLVRAIVANDMELWWVKNQSTGVEMAVDRREFQMLFPGQPTEGATRLASTQQVRPRAENVAAPGGSQKLAMVASELAAMAPTRSSARPVLTEKDAGQWVLVDKVMDGSAPATFSAPDMARYNLAANVVTTATGERVLVPIETDEELKDFFDADNIRRLDSSWSEGLVVFLTMPMVRGVLIVIFLLALFGEMSHPGAIVPGLVALVALLALLGPPLLIGMASWWEVLAIVLGIGLVALEAFVIPGTTVAGVAGLVLLFGGLVATFLPSGQGMFPSSAQQSGDLAWGVGTVLAALITAGVGMFFMARHFGSLPFFNKMVLKGTPEEVADITTMGMADTAGSSQVKLGQTGVAITRMGPAGRVEIDGRVIDAVSDFGFIQPGTAIRVSSVDGMRVGVERDLRTPPTA